MFKAFSWHSALVLLVTVIVSSSTALAQTGPSVVPIAQVQANYIAGTSTTDNFGASWVMGPTQPAIQPALGAAAKDAGVRWTREDASWFRTEIPANQCPPASYDGRYCWESMDRAANQSVANGLQVIFVFQYSVQQYSGNPTASNYHIFAPNTPAGRAAWSQFVTATVQRYKDRVHHWQLWLAIDDPTVWNVVPGNSDIGVYAPLLQSTYGAMKGADPSAKLVLAAMRDPQLTELLNAGVANSFDIVATSNYAAFENPGRVTPPMPEASTLVATRIPAMRDIIHNRAPGKPLWVTEYAWGVSPPGTALQFGVSEDEQAQYLIRSLLLQNAEPEVGTILWSFFYDPGSGTGGPEMGMGMLLKFDMVTKKIAFNAYKAMTTALAGAQFQSLSLPSTASHLVEGFETGRV